MKNKKARYIVQAIQSWNTNNKTIFDYVKENMKTYVTQPNINYITNCLEIGGYVKSVRVGRILTRSMLREVSGQIDIKI